jgi:site-specific DNA-methyltransferase (adenine-specific)
MSRFGGRKMTQLIHGDCLEKMKDIPDGSVDMVLTDPPYGTTACKWDTVIPFEPMWEQLNRIIKLNGVVVLFGQEPFSSFLRISNIKNYRFDFIWQKTRPTLFQHANKRPMKDHELISVFYKAQPTYNLELLPKEKPTNNFRKNKTGELLGKGCKDTGLVQTETGYNRQIMQYKMHNVGNLHPTQKPLELIQKIVKTYTHEGETVLDFTMGSGTTGVACKNLNRNFIGIELDENYFNIAKKRIEESK